MQAHIGREVLHIVTRGGDRLSSQLEHSKASIRYARVLKPNSPGVAPEALPGGRHVATGVDQHPLGTAFPENLDRPVHDVSLCDPVERHCHPGLLEGDLAVAHLDMTGPDERQGSQDLLSRRRDSRLGKTRAIEVEQRSDGNIKRTGG